jgi:uncharacterized protein (TIGR02246 family)
VAVDNKLRKLADPAAQDSAPAEDRQAAATDAQLTPSPGLEEFYQKLQPEMRRPKPGPAEMAAALEAVQRLAVEAGAEDAAAEFARRMVSDASAPFCHVCGYRNREGNKFCGMCGQPVESSDETEPHEPHPPKPFALPQPPQTELASGTRNAPAVETHHYHHHYHHHYFPGGHESLAPRVPPDPLREAERLRPSPVLRGESMSRAEAAVRRVTQDWILACNTKHLDDLLDVYAADALVLRSNHPAVRGAAAVREFFFNALNSGLGEVELDPIRVDVVGDLAYEAGRCKALVPGTTGMRREERGKYLWVFARQSSGDWRLAADCWSSDLTLPTAEADAKPGPKPIPPRKS